MKLFASLLFLFSASIAYAQKLPVIGSEKGLKEKFTMIKEGLPEIKKNLSIKDENQDTYLLKFKIGDGTTHVEENETSQYFQILFSKRSFSGTITDFQNFYKHLVPMITEIFGTAYEQKTKKEDNSWETIFSEIAPDKYSLLFDAHTTITVKVIWNDNTPQVTIRFSTRNPLY